MALAVNSDAEIPWIRSDGVEVQILAEISFISKLLKLKLFQNLNEKSWKIVAEKFGG